MRRYEIELCLRKFRNGDEHSKLTHAIIDNGGLRHRTLDAARKSARGLVKFPAIKSAHVSEVTRIPRGYIRRGEKMFRSENERGRA